MDGDGFLGRGQGLLPPPQARQAARLVVQRSGEVGEERVGAGLGELAVDAAASSAAARASSRRPRLTGKPTGCSATWRGRGGTRRGGPGRAGGRSCGLLDRGQGLLPPPQVCRQLDWLFSDPARSGRKASGRAWASWR